MSLNPRESFICGVCYSELLSRSGYLCHREKFHSYRHRCYLCDPRGKLIQGVQIKEHLQTIHNFKNIFACMCCYYVFDSQRSRQMHYTHFNDPGYLEKEKVVARSVHAPGELLVENVMKSKGYLEFMRLPTRPRRVFIKQEPVDTYEKQKEQAPERRILIKQEVLDEDHADYQAPKLFTTKSSKHVRFPKSLIKREKETQQAMFPLHHQVNQDYRNWNIKQEVDVDADVPKGLQIHQNAPYISFNSPVKQDVAQDLHIPQNLPISALSQFLQNNTNNSVGSILRNHKIMEMYKQYHSYPRVQEETSIFSQQATLPAILVPKYHVRMVPEINGTPAHLVWEKSNDHQAVTVAQVLDECKKTVTPVEPEPESKQDPEIHVEEEDIDDDDPVEKLDREMRKFVQNYVSTTSNTNHCNHHYIQSRSTKPRHTTTPISITPEQLRNIMDTNNDKTRLHRIEAALEAHKTLRQREEDEKKTIKDLIVQVKTGLKPTGIQLIEPPRLEEPRVEAPVVVVQNQQNPANRPYIDVYGFEREARARHVWRPVLEQMEKMLPKIKQDLEKKLYI